jgi:hypothetical protein
MLASVTVMQGVRNRIWHFCVSHASTFLIYRLDFLELCETSEEWREGRTFGFQEVASSHEREERYAYPPPKDI